MNTRQTDEEARRDDYFRRVERHFGQRRGGPLLLSPRDWQVVERWFDRGIPLDTVLRGINRAFDRFDATGSSSGKVNSLAYCKQQVEAAWDEHRPQEAFSSSEPGGAKDPAAEHLEATASACRTAMASAPELAGALEIAAAALERLAGEANTLGATELDRRANAIEAAYGVAVGSPGAPAAPRLPRFSPWSV